MRSSLIGTFFLAGASILALTSSVAAQQRARDFVPGELLVGYASPQDADAALNEAKAAKASPGFRGLPAVGIQAKKSGESTLKLHIDFVDSILSRTIGEPQSELRALENFAAQLKRQDQRVLYATPNWKVQTDPDEANRAGSLLQPESLLLGPAAEDGKPIFKMGIDGPRGHDIGAPDDAYFPLQWDFLPPPRGMNAIGAWRVTRGSRDVVVAVVDTGLRFDNDEIKGSQNVLPGYNFISATSCVDKTGRGPSAADPGDDAESCRPADAAADWKPDPSWHGTHVAGTIGAERTDGGEGVAGVNWEVTVLPVRVLGHGGGTTADINDGLRWAAGLHVDGVPDNPHPADVINMSLGRVLANDDGTLATCDMENDGATIQALAEVRKAGTVIVVSAGNGYYVDSENKVCEASAVGKPGSTCARKPINFKNWSPAGCPGVISVAASGMDGHLASYSNFGDFTVMAPGGNNDRGAILQPDGAVFQKSGRFGDILSTAGKDYRWMAGTSMAAPHVSGAIALALAANPKLRRHPDLIEAALRAAIVPAPEGACPADTPCGSGMLDAARLVRPDPTQALRVSP